MMMMDAGACGSAREDACRFRPLLPHEHRVALALHSPAGDRIQRGRAKRFAASQAETGVMKRAPHGVADHQPVGERTVIMSAVGAHGEELVRRARQDHILVAHPPEHHATWLDRAHGEAVGEIRSRRFFGLSHA